MSTTRALNVFALVLVASSISAIAARNIHARAPVSLLNVSYDPTRELYAKLIVTDERVVRERVPSDPPASGVGIYDLEGELFFGAAPDLDEHLARAFGDARSHGIKHIVLRVKRVRSPDAVCFERLEHALREAKKEGFTVLLAGIKPDLQRGLERLHFDAFLPRDQWFPEEDETYSATLKAVRKGYELVGVQRPQGEAVVYYLV